MQRARGTGPIACGGTLDQGAPQVTIHAPTDGAQYIGELPFHVTASDSEGVKDIDVLVDGKEVAMETVVNGTGATLKYTWKSASKLSYGPHTVTAIARDEARNEGKSSVKVVHVGGGNYPYTVKTSFSMKVGKVRNGKAIVRGRIKPKGTIATVARGRAYVAFQRFDTKSKRWRKFQRVSRDGKTPWRISYRFAKRGVWRIVGEFKPYPGYGKSRARISRLKVR